MRLFGHPLHPMLAHFPVACWVLATLCDGLAFAGYGPAWIYAALLLAAGLALAVPAMIAGFVDLTKISDDSAATLANYHMMLMGGAWTIYLIALLTRLKEKTLIEDPAILPIVLSVSGLVTMAAGGWLGGQLVYHHGIGTRFQNMKKEGNNNNQETNS